MERHSRAGGLGPPTLTIILRVLDLATGAHGVVGGGGQAHWSPVPVVAETGEG